MKKSSQLLMVVLFVLFSLPLLSQDNDHELVQSAIEDYVNALYNVEPAKIERSVDPTLRKIGYWYDSESNEYKDNLPMTYQQLYDLAGTWNKNGDRHWQYVSKDLKTGLLEFSQGPSSDVHAQGWDQEDLRPEHEFLRVKGGFLAVQVDRENKIPRITFTHYNVDGTSVNSKTIAHK